MLVLAFLFRFLRNFAPNYTILSLSIILFLETFSHQRSMMVFPTNFNDSKSPQITRTLPSIQVDLNITAVWVVSTHPPTSKSFSPFNNPLVTVPKAPITIGITVTCMFHSFFNSLARSRYLSFFSLTFSFILLLSLLLLYTPFILFHISISWWFLTGVWTSGGLLKSPRLFSVRIMAQLYNALVWMVSICPLISKTSRLFTNPLEIVLNAPTGICISVTYMFYSCFLFFFKV